MIVRDVNECVEFLAGDSTHLRELLHPAKAPLALRYSLAHAVVPPHKASTPHSLKTSEVYYILEGTGRMHINDETADVKPGQAIYIPPEAIQYIENTGTSDLKFICIVDPAWRPEDEIILLNR